MITNVQLTQSQLQQYFSPRKQRYVALTLALLLTLAAIWWLAQLTWQLLTPAEQVLVMPQSDVQGIAQGAPETNLARIQQLNIFGDREAEPAAAQQAIEAPETTLNVTLVGLVASVNPLRSAAIIEHGGSQQTYIIGERIQNSRARLEAIYSDRVILDNNGRREALYIEGRDGSEAQIRVQSSAPAATRERPAAEQRVTPERTEEVTQAMQQVRENPQQLLEIINISALREGGELVGYRLQPRQNRELFTALGLQPGDVATAINGYDLSDPGQALAAMNELQDATSAVVQIRRGDDLLDLELSIP